MKIHSMTATFGKLEHATLTLQPGLNIIHAPNEWGKSTWCAFLTNMLYGVDTKARTTAASLADKERYAPWSGAPMSGRMDITWQGRDITIERRSKGRIPFGEFRAYETATGIEVPELTASNCGEQLLGVERSVFLRAGFLKLADLPVTQDDSLRRRLNNLVTTGDESGAGDQLAGKLKDLKNKCRHNQTGLLPQAERERDQLLQQMDELYRLQKQMEANETRQQELKEQNQLLENHKAALRYASALSDMEKVKDAKDARDRAAQALQDRETACSAMMPRQEAQQKRLAAQTLQDRWMALQMEDSALPQRPQEPSVPAHYAGLSDPVAASQADFDRQSSLEAGRKKWNRVLTVLLCVAAVLLIGSIAAGFILEMPLLMAAGGGLTAVLVAVLLAVSAGKAKTFRREMDALYDRHPGLPPAMWVEDAQRFEATLAQHRQALAEYAAQAELLDDRQQALDSDIKALTGGEPLAQCQQQWQHILDSWDALGDAQRDLRQAQGHLQALQSLVKTAEPPAQPDALTLSEPDTDARLNSNRFEQRKLQLELGQYQGKAGSIGNEPMLRARLETLNRRITRLEDTYYALEMAQEALREAASTLQRRFAPRISKRAQELFQKLTQGRYQRITLGSDLALSAGALEEDTLRPALWRSDGTVDQLYLALRLAVAEELTPKAPLVLDDALVRFDDDRLKVALGILKEAAESKQVILFTCQSREEKLL